MTANRTAVLERASSEELSQDDPSSSRSPTSDSSSDDTPTLFQPLRPMPKVHFYGNFVMCKNRNCQDKYCTFAHSIEELRAWNAQRRDARTDSSSKGARRERREREAGRRTSSTEWSTFRRRVQQELVIDDIEEELTVQNYKERFHKLLCWEEKARTDILVNRCDGEYTLVLHKDGYIPPYLHRGIRDYHVLFGLLENVAGDVVANATQASERAVLTVSGGKCSVTADIPPENYNHTSNHLYLAFDQKSSQQLLEAMGTLERVEIRVEFELNHRYFDSLHSALDTLPADVVRKLMPSQDDFSRPLRRFNKLVAEYDELQMDNGESGEQQSQALKTALVYPAADPPVLILGSFGAGKTRVLAAAAYHIFNENNSGPRRVLVCSHQVSADLFIERYFGVIRNDTQRPWQGMVIRLVPTFRKDTGSYSLLYKTIEESSKLLNYECSKHIIVVTTYNTSMELQKVVPHGYFTHILLDDAAQVSEPEALCPLAMATSNTTIIMAGDEYQFRPVVLGVEALANGLGTSLLTRLLELYKGIGPQATSRCSVLSTNYRCHSEIANLSSRLFYNSGVRLRVSESPTHPLAPHPLVFVCSSLDCTPRCITEDTNEKEASVLLEQLVRFAEAWPDEWGQRDMATISIVVSSRRQVTVVKRHAKKKYKDLGLHEAKIAPVYGMLGQEFRALFLGTSEPTWENGEIRNLTKSTCNPYVFNTALTRAQSLVVAVGNPLTLLRAESCSPYKERCWTEYLKLCLDNDTIMTTSQLEEEWKTRGIHLLRHELQTMQ